MTYPLCKDCGIEEGYNDGRCRECDLNYIWQFGCCEGCGRLQFNDLAEELGLGKQHDHADGCPEKAKGPKA